MQPFSQGQPASAALWPCPRPQASCQHHMTLLAQKRDGPAMCQGSLQIPLWQPTNPARTTTRSNALLTAPDQGRKMPLPTRAARCPRVAGMIRTKQSSRLVAQQQALARHTRSPVGLGPAVKALCS